MAAAENPLESHVRTLIEKGGPITIARFMQLVLYHPEHGYYMQEEPFGAKGDFVTAPEISQMFGEMLGVWVADLWQRSGEPETICLIELGPGNGTLMADMLRATKSVPGLHAALMPILIEISPRLRAKQAHTLKDCGIEIEWKSHLSELEPGPFTIIVGNEFLDALPVHQCVLTDHGWVEQGVGLDANGKFCFTLTNQPLPVYPERWKENAKPGALRELCPEAAAIIKQAGRLFTGRGGACLFIDYGYADVATNPGTLQALKHHQYHPVLEALGTADITAHVDFLALKDAALAAHLMPLPLATQGNFLNRLGIHARLKALEARANAEQKKALASQMERLILPDQMGTLFKVFAATSSNLPVPLGFYEVKAA